MLERVVDLVDRERDLGGVGLDAGLADVDDQRIDQAVFLLDEERSQCSKVGPPGLDVTKHSAVEPFAELLDDLGNALDGSHGSSVGGQVGWCVGQ